jgi:hypothetical protein
MLPPMLVTEAKNHGRDAWMLLIIVRGVQTVEFVLVFFVIPDARHFLGYNASSRCHIRRAANNLRAAQSTWAAFAEAECARFLPPAGTRATPSPAPSTPYIIHLSYLQC